MSAEPGPRPQTLRKPAVRHWKLQLESIAYSPCWNFLRRGNDVAQMMQVTGEEGVSLEDHLVHQKSLFLDMVYFQQDAFDQVDASAPIPRQKRTFDLVSDLVNRPYQFKDKSAIRDYFVRLTGLFKNLNYSQEETAQYKEFLSKIQELADSTVNQNVKS